MITFPPSPEPWVRKKHSRTKPCHRLVYILHEGPGNSPGEWISADTLKHQYGLEHEPLVFTYMRDLLDVNGAIHLFPLDEHQVPILEREKLEHSFYRSRKYLRLLKEGTMYQNPRLPSGALTR